MTPHSLPPLRRPITGSGTVLEVLNPRLVRVRMANGYETLAHWLADEPGSLPELQPGTVLALEFSPYDMRQARILPQGD